jgi:hypothetical protein
MAVHGAVFSNLGSLNTNEKMENNFTVRLKHSNNSDYESKSKMSFFKKTSICIKETLLGKEKVVTVVRRKSYASEFKNRE